MTVSIAPPAGLYDGHGKGVFRRTPRGSPSSATIRAAVGRGSGKGRARSKANSMAYQPALEKIVTFDTN